MKHVVEFQTAVVEVPKFAEKYIRQIMDDLRSHDPGTYEHCVRVSEQTLAISREMGHNILLQGICMYSGLLHDLGKLRVPAEIINKPGKLTGEEFEIMKKHADYGAELVAPLNSLPFFQKVSEAILYHHERVDGRGYHGLPEEKIPVPSKVILVVDTVDAMTQDRPYRKGCTMERAIDELIQCSGTQFDRSIVDVYLRILEQRRQAA